MTPEAQRIAIATALGWSQIQNASSIRIGGLWTGYPPVNPIIGQQEVLPDFLNDLNAMHEAVMSLSDNKRDIFNLKLSEITEHAFDFSETCDFDAVVNATAAQRAEAFLRTLSKWEETPSRDPAPQHSPTSPNSAPSPAQQPKIL